MKRGLDVKSIGFMEKSKDGRMVMVWPAWLPQGKHRISITKKSGWGLLVKTDRCPFWMNANWFTPI